MKKRVLITGATGFVGKWALRHWRSVHPEVELWATSNELPASDIEADKFIQTDFCDFSATNDLISQCQPDDVVHLAGTIGNVDLSKHLQVNVLAAENLYNALVQSHNALDKLCVVQAGSAAIYGLVRPEELPITEGQIPRPISSYGLSKLAQDHLAMSMCHNRKIKIICARVFNILGPSQPETLVPMTFIKQLVDIKTGKSDRLRVGDISTRRDFIDVRDVVTAFDFLLQKGKAGQVYNVGSGRDISIKEIIDNVLQISGLKVEIESDAGRLRTCDVPCVRADISKISNATGWIPKISTQESLEAMWQQIAP